MNGRKLSRIPLPVNKLRLRSWNKHCAGTYVSCLRIPISHVNSPPLARLQSIKPKSLNCVLRSTSDSCSSIERLKRNLYRYQNLFPSLTLCQAHHDWFQYRTRNPLIFRPGMRLVVLIRNPQVGFPSMNGIMASTAKTMRLISLVARLRIGWMRRLLPTSLYYKDHLGIYSIECTAWSPIVSG